jgi:hypothetical protein
MSSSSRTSREFAVSPRTRRVAIGLGSAALTLVPTLIVMNQWLMRKAGEEPKTSAWSIIPGALIVGWGAIYSGVAQRLVLDSSVRTVSWVTTIHGFPYKEETWAWKDVTAIEVVSKSAGRSRGRCAVAVGPKGERVVYDYFHRTTPLEIGEMAGIIGVDVIDRIQEAKAKDRA